jgi:drug/metabolite transporter (DMT)-like permease
LTCAVYNLLTKWALTKGSVNPMVYCFYRDVAACPLLFLAAVLVDGHHPVPARADLLRLSVLGLTGLFGNQVLFILGMQRTSPFIAAVVSQTQ